MHQIRSAIMSGQGHPEATPIASKKGRSRPSGGASLTAIPVKREESRLTDHRGEDRIGVAEAITIHFRRRKYSGRVVNISASGGMIACEVEPHIGDMLDIELAAADRGQCVVRWVRDGRIGVEFVGFSLSLGRSEAGEFVFQRAESEPGGDKTARAPRQTMVWMATLHVGGTMIAARLHNVSPGGAMLDLVEAQEIAEGADVMLDLAGAGLLAAKICWATAGQIGVSFKGEFDPTILSDCARAAQPAPEGTSWLKPAYLETELDPDSPWAARWETLKPSDLA